MGSYLASTPQEQQAMLEQMGHHSFDDLFADVPSELREYQLQLPEGLSEMALKKKMAAIAAKNHVFASIFRGAGAYDHYIPSIVKQVVAKEEFLTAYTPYQAEISQGILQSIFEYQTMICELTGMDVANASVYDGATAAAEAVKMCVSRKRKTIVVSEACHPDVLAVIKTYCYAANEHLVLIPSCEGHTDQKALQAALNEDTACVLVQQPSYFGVVEDVEAICEQAHQAGAKMIVHMHPIAAALFKTPGEIGADIACGEGQPLGMSLSFGGPYLGFMAAKSDMTRQLPGRIVGETVDVDGKRAYVLTLQAREQHIKREKASSSICSNQALCALTAAVYLAAMGPHGLREVAEQCYAKAHYLADALASNGYSLAYDGEFFNEFVTTSPVDPERVMARLEEEDILGGLPLGDGRILWCCTEKNTKEDMDRLVAVLKEVAAQ